MFDSKKEKYPFQRNPYSNPKKSFFLYVHYPKRIFKYHLQYLKIIFICSTTLLLELFLYNTSIFAIMTHVRTDKVRPDGHQEESSWERRPKRKDRWNNFAHCKRDDKHRTVMNLSTAPLAQRKCEKCSGQPEMRNNHVVIHQRLARPIFVRGICRARNFVGRTRRRNSDGSRGKNSEKKSEERRRSRREKSEQSDTQGWGARGRREEQVKRGRGRGEIERRQK